MDVPSSSSSNEGSEERGVNNNNKIDARNKLQTHKMPIKGVVNMVSNRINNNNNNNNKVKKENP